MDNIYYLGLTDSAECKRLVCGRTNDLRRLLNYIYAGKNVALFGERRIGKTSTLYLIRDIINGAITQYQDRLFDETLKQAVPDLRPQDGNRWQAVYLSCQGLHPVNLETFFDKVMHELSGVISPKPKMPLSQNTDISGDLRTLHTKLPEDQRVVILVDEVDTLFDAPQEEHRRIFNLLRDIMHACPKFCFVLAGAEHWYRDIKTRSSPLINNITSYFLRTPEPNPLEVHLIGYLTQQLSNHQEEVRRTIVEWSGYKPYYIQAICSEIISICQGGTSLPDRWEQDVEKKVIEQTKLTIQAFFETDNLDNLTRRILAVLAHTPGLNVPQIAQKLGASKEKVWDKISDLETLGKVRREKSGCRIIGWLLERWGRENEENPAKSPWPQRLRWGLAFVLLVLCVLLYGYTHPPLRTFSHAFSDTSVSVYLLASLEKDETGTATVRIQNTTPSTVYTVTVILSSGDIDFREGDSNRATFPSVYPGEIRYWEPRFVAHSPITSSLLSFNVSVTQDGGATIVSPTFQVSYRSVALKKYWLVVNGILVAISAFINKNDLMQLAISLWALLKKTHIQSEE